MLRRPFSTEVLQLLEAMDSAGQTIRAGAWLWYPSMAGAIREPSFSSTGPAPRTDALLEGHVHQTRRLPAKDRATFLQNDLIVQFIAE